MTFSKLQLSQRENLQKCTGFEKEGIFKETFILTLSSSVVLRLQNCVSDFFCFDREIKGFYQSSLGNWFDFANIMNFPKYLG